MQNGNRSTFPFTNFTPINAHVRSFTQYIMPNIHKTHPRKGLLGPQKNFPLATYKRLALMDLRGPFSFSLSSLLSPFPQQSGQPKERRPSGKSSVGLLALIAFRWQYFKKRTSLVPASLVPCIVNLTHIHLGTPERAYSVYARRNRGERERETRENVSAMRQRPPLLPWRWIILMFSLLRVRRDYSSPGKALVKGVGGGGVS